MNGEIRTKKRLGDDGEWQSTTEYLIDGQRVTEAEWLEAFPPSTGVPLFARAINDAKPLRSEALAVHRKQIPAVLARNARHGIHIPYDRLGRPVFTDAGQRRKLMKLEKVRSQNSYYGD